VNGGLKPVESCLASKGNFGGGETPNNLCSAMKRAILEVKFKD